MSSLALNRLIRANDLPMYAGLRRTQIAERHGGRECLHALTTIRVGRS